MNAKLFFKTIALATVLAGCASSNGENSPYVMPYVTPEELAKRQSPVTLLPPDSSGNIVFNLQYPSGTKDGGMITSPLDKNSDFKIHGQKQYRLDQNFPRRLRSGQISKWLFCPRRTCPKNELGI